MWLFVALSLAVIGDDPGTLVDEFDLVEVNHVCDVETGLVLFDQVMWLDWHPSEKKHRVESWMMMKGHRAEKKPELSESSRLRTSRMSPLDRETFTSELRRQLKGKFNRGKLYPIRDYRRNRFVVSFFDSEQSMPRIVISKRFRETWTLGDPEVRDRAGHPEAIRRGLTKPPVKDE